jgi:phosphoribosylformylglycinamidine cyclo-ligase
VSQQYPEPDRQDSDPPEPGAGDPGRGLGGGPGVISYADSGVDLDAADRSVAELGRVLQDARRPEVIGGIGGFGGLFAFDAAAYREPVLVSSTDGVGTKVDLARQLDVLETVGRDLVAMVVDDLVVPGAEPLFFNDYLVVGRLDPERVTRIVAGIAEGCRLAACALVGGETAEHPGLLPADAFDLAGFGVGVVERGAILGPERVRPGDALIGMASSGLHSNGFSLVRRIVRDLDLERRHGLDRPLGEVLLEPTRIYAPDCLALRDALEVHAFCHVTGGGIVGNLPRILPSGLGAVVDTASWVRPAVFDLLQTAGPVGEEEMWRTFNLGVGMVAVVEATQVQDALVLLERRGVPAWPMGEVSAEPGVELVGAGADR